MCIVNFIALQMKSFGSKMSNYMQAAGVKKCHFGNFSDRAGILFALGSYEFLAMLEGKTRKGLFFRVQACKITVCNDDNVSTFHMHTKYPCKALTFLAVLSW